MGDENKRVDLTGYNSEFDDIFGGIKHRENQTGTNIKEEGWVKYPGREVVYGKDEENTKIEYPLLLINAKTETALRYVKDSMQMNKFNYEKDIEKYIGESGKVVNVYKTWEDGTATYVGKGVITHEVWYEMHKRKLKPVLYLKKGEKLLVTSGKLYNYKKYNPIILPELETDETCQVPEELLDMIDSEDEDEGDLSQKPTYEYNNPNLLKWEKEDNDENSENLIQKSTYEYNNPDLLRWEKEDNDENSETLNWESKEENTINEFNNIIVSSENDESEDSEDKSLSDLDDLVPNIAGSSLFWSSEKED